jgi:protein TonB
MVAAGETPYVALTGQVWRAGLTRMLLLSLGLHVAVIMIVQPRPFLDIAEVVVIEARLTESGLPLPASAAPPPEAASTVSPPVPVPDAVPAPEPAPPPQPAMPEPVAKPPVPPADAAVVPPRPAPRSEPAPAPALPSVPVLIDTNWYEARQLDVQPRALRTVTPRYPPDAARRGVEGSVKLRLKVDEYGMVKEVEVEEGDPPGVFDESALEAFRQGRFSPAQRDGRPVRALIHIRVRYQLEDG